MNMRHAATLTFLIALSTSSHSQAPTSADVAFKLSYCGELSMQLSALSANPSLKEQRAGAALRYLLPVVELVPVEAERKAITEAAAKAIEQQSRALRESQRLLVEAYESARVSFAECNQIRANLDAARPPVGPASAPRQGSGG